MEKLRGNESITKPTNTQEGKQKRGYKTIWARFLNSPRYRDSLTIF